MSDRAYFQVGIDLRTEEPKSKDIRRAAERLLNELHWKQNVARLRDEFNAYEPNELIDAALAQGTTTTREESKQSFQAI